MPTLRTIAISVSLLTTGILFAGAPLTVSGQTTIAPLIEQVTDAVVNISAFRVRGNQVLTPRDRRIRDSIGSGVIIDAEKGFIVTNHHVVDDSWGWIVTLNDGRDFEAELIGSDVETDVALIQIDADDLLALEMADSDSVRVGDFVVAIGSPFGLRQTVTSGIVSALGREDFTTDTYQNFIQTDAAINPGNSGGPLMNFQGEIIGINTAIVGTSRGGVGIGFAIPANMVQAITGQIIEFGSVNRGILGIKMDNINSTLKEVYELDSTNGVIVVEVLEGTMAEEAGVKANDIIVAIDDESIKNSNHLRNVIGLRRVGDQIGLNIIRDGKHIDVQATIGEKLRLRGEDLSEKLAGIMIKDLDPNDPDEAEIYELLQGYGLVIDEIDLDSNLAELGVKEGDVINYVNGYRINSLSAIEALVASEAIRAISIYRNGRTVNIPFGETTF
ncbi:MAG: trypsin-like peptidase domain-containing protein [Gammaproteobacteria bacterium]|nr:trypsin-like peptidase domain-containing protein [Gammaproteobacteria bacterium]MDE0251939.1 trypsin-like peptidase domain-containing protein [Gammaproteobacteria bacterium]MDE0403053.1 trypsin-like peptidase domain-containing protein [Gammaproteobacteria bacterium]